MLLGMKHQEFYRKFKTNYPSAKHPIFSKKNWRPSILAIVIAVSIEPLIIMQKHQRVNHFSLHHYFQLIEYLFLVITPFLTFLLWGNWRDRIKRSKGYGWLGQFEVINKRSLWLSSYLLLKPGNNNKLRANRDIFEKIRIGDVVQIRRDAFGGIEETTKIRSLSSRLNWRKSSSFRIHRNLIN